MPRSEPDSYIVYPTGFDEVDSDEKLEWCLVVKNGHAHGWSIRQMTFDRYAMNRRGQWIPESRGHEQNKYRRYSLEEALQIAEKYVDKNERGRIGTFAQYTAWLAARRAS